MKPVPHFLDIAPLRLELLERLIERGFFFKRIAREATGRLKSPLCMEKRLVLLFFEPSTRTRTSFSLAAKQLGFDLQQLEPGSMSLVKGEKLIENFLNLGKLGFDVAVVRHPSSGALHFLSRHIGVSLVNAGDGCHAHPSQALLDLMTIKERFGELKGLHVGIVGDVAKSRVARSDIHALRKFGATVSLIGPPHFVPDTLERPGVRVSHDLDGLIKGLDVLVMLRIQTERAAYDPLLSLSWYREAYAITLERFSSLPDHSIVLHPGPVSLGIEMDEEVLKLDRCLSYTQVENGVFARMAVLEWAMEGRGRCC